MTTQTQRRNVLTFNNTLVWILCSLAIYLDNGFSIVGVLSEAGLTVWVFKVWFNRMELKVVEWRNGSS